MNSIEKFWDDFINENPQYRNSTYVVDYFGTKDDATELGNLIKSHIKTATCSAYPLYEIENETVPEVGTITLVTDSSDQPLCIIENTKVYIEKFSNISDEHAYMEGEGNRSFDYWRNVHVRYFKAALAEYNLEFDESLPLLCEEFTCIYPK